MSRLTYEKLKGVALLNACGVGCNGDCNYCERLDEAIEKLKAYEDAEEQGLLLRLDSKDKLIEVLATKLLNTEFGYCYMCTNPMKNITLDGANNGCDGQCNTLEKFTVDDFLKKIIEEMQRKEKQNKN